MLCYIVNIPSLFLAKGIFDSSVGSHQAGLIPGRQRFWTAILLKRFDILQRCYDMGQRLMVRSALECVGEGSDLT